MNYDSRASQHDPTLCKLYHRISGECGSSILSSGDLVTIQLGNEYLHPVVFLGLTDRDLQARATRLSYRVNGCSGWCLTLSIRSRISASQSSSDNSKISLHWMVLESGVFRSDELMLLQVASTTLRPGLMGADLCNVPLNFKQHAQPLMHRFQQLDADNSGILNHQDLQFMLDQMQGTAAPDKTKLRRGGTERILDLLDKGAQRVKVTLPQFSPRSS